MRFDDIQAFDDGGTVDDNQPMMFDDIQPEEVPNAGPIQFNQIQPPQAPSAPQSPQVGPIGAAVAGAAPAAAPITAAIAAGARTMAATSEFGPWVSIPAGLGAGLIASGVVGKIQDWLRDQYGPSTGPLSKPYEAAAAEQQPISYNIGRAAPIAAGMTTGNVTPLVRAASAGILGSVDVLQQGIEKGFGNINPTEALVQAGAGALLPQAREWAGGARPYTATAAPQVGEEGVTPSGTTATPVPKTSAQGGETPVGKPAAPDALAEQQLQGTKSAPFNTSPSVGTAFKQPRSAQLPVVGENTVTPAETISVVQSNRQGLKGGVGPGQVGSGVEGAPSTLVDTDPIPEDVAAAINPTSAEGAPVAPAPEATDPTPSPAVTQGSTPAPAQSLPASRPSVTPSLTANSMLATPSPAMAAARNLQARKTIRNTKLDTGMMTPSMQRILGTAPPEPTPVETTPTGLAGQVRPVTGHPDIDNVVKAATDAAAKRAIIDTVPMPSIANSSKADLTNLAAGHVLIDPQVVQDHPEFVPPLAVHETVEGALKALGVSDDLSHRIATGAERAEAERRGINWDEYSQYFKDVSPRIEAQKIMPDAWDKYNLHIDPYDAIGHHTNKDILSEFQAAEATPPGGEEPAASQVSTPGAETVPPSGKAEDFLRRQPPAAQAAIAESTGMPQAQRQAMLRGNMPPKLQQATNALLTKWNEMTGGGGGGKIPPPESLNPNPHDPANPHADQEAQDYADSIYDKVNLMKTRARNALQSIQNMFMKTPSGSDADWAAVGQAWTRHTEDQLPDNLKPLYDYYSKVIAPKQQQVAQETYDLNKKWKLFNMDKIHEGIQTRFMPRQRLGEDDIPRGEDVVTGQDMSGWNPSVARRDFKTAFQVGKDGKPLPGAQPILIKDQGDGSATQWLNKKPVNFTYETDEDTPSLRDVGTFFTDENGKRWVVDHADAQHIEDQGIVNPLTGQPMEYNKNPVTASMISIEGLTKARDTMKLLEDIKTDPKFKDNFETDPAAAKEKWGGLYRTNLEQFQGKPGKPLYMSQATAQALNDFRKPGIAMPNALTAAANGLIKTMYVPGFPIHGLNVAAQWFIGKPWANTQAWRGLLEDWPTAFKDVMTQGPIQQEIREAGGQTQLWSVLSDKNRADIFRNAGQEMVKENKFWKPFADKFGTTVPQLAQDVYDWSRYELWRMNDILYTQQYMTFRQRMGLSPEEAVKRTEDFISNYRLNNKVLGQRWLANVYNTPAISLFGRYHQGLWNSWQKVAGGLAPGANPEDRKNAAVAAIAMGVLGLFVYPYILNPIARGVTGNPEASFGPRGMLTIPAQAAKIATGEQGYESLVPNVFTPSLPISAAMGAVRNLDWTGQPLIPRNDLTKPGNAARAVIQGVDAAGRVLVPPYSSLASDLAEKGTNPARVAGKLLTQNLGIKNPSQASVNYMNRIQQNNARLQHEHRAGPLERVYNKLVGQ